MPTVLADTQNLIADLIARYRSRVDYLAIRLEESEGTSIIVRGNKVETLSEGLSIGGQVRACYKGGWGFASFNQLSSLKERLEEAISAARIVGDGETLLASIPIVQDTRQLPLTGTDPRMIPLTEKKALCDRYNQLLKRFDPRITTTSVRYGDSHQRIIIATS
ncbi:MAG: DNA gyrase modulator, partial [Coleofasciculus sp. C2-GNP5-27]